MEIAKMHNTTSIDDSDFQIGLSLAVSSSLFIGTSFIIKKKALIRLTRCGGLSAGAGGFGYLKEWMWWTGFITMGLGELANFAAYAFAPASLVTPLGALSVLVSAILSSKFLKEGLNFIGKLGCMLCILGSTIIVIHSPKEQEVTSLQILLEKMQDSLFVLYVVMVVLLSCAIMCYYGPKYGRKNVIVYILICSAIGSLTVMSCKGLGLALKETFSGGDNAFRHWLTYILFLAVFLCICIQMDYLNKALDLFNTSIVTPVYYVTFTTFVIVASTILFKEWESLSGEDVIGNVCGFLVIIVGITLLHAFKDVDVSVKDIRSNFKPVSEALIRVPSYDYGTNVEGANEHLIARSI